MEQITLERRDEVDRWGSEGVIDGGSRKKYTKGVLSKLFLQIAQACALNQTSVIFKMKGCCKRELLCCSQFEADALVGE